jgi:hypothetical protein
VRLSRRPSRPMSVLSPLFYLNDQISHISTPRWKYVRTKRTKRTKSRYKTQNRSGAVKRESSAHTIDADLGGFVAEQALIFLPVLWWS